LDAFSSSAPVRSSSGPSYDSHAGTSLRTRRMRAFHPTYRRFVQQLTSCSPIAEELTDTFPGLLFALATGYGTPEARAASFSSIQSGGSLKDAAAKLGLPYWLRKLPAEAFGEPLHALPLSSEFSSRIASHIPQTPAASRAWLWAVSYACAAHNEDFALWTAASISKHHRLVSTPHGRDTFRYLAAWSWYATSPLSTGFDLLRRPWTPSIGLRRALDELGTWRRRISLVVALGGTDPGGWLENGTALGHDFVALTSPLDFIRESEAMDNCLDQFGNRLQQTASRVFAIRKSGRSVANVEIGLHEQEVTMPAILQLRAPRNRRASAEVWQATYAWLGMQSLRPRYASATRINHSRCRRAARAFWQPYLDHLEPRGLDTEFADLVLSRRTSAKSAEDEAQPVTLSRRTAIANSEADTSRP